MSNVVELRVGAAGAPYDPSGRVPLEKIAADPSLFAPGVPCSAFRAFSITPLTLQANNIAALQTPSGAGNFTLAAGTGVTAVTITPGGVSTAAFDITGGVFSRSIRIVGQGGVTQRTYTITGYDEYGLLTTLAITGPNGNQTIETLKMWRYITNIAVSGGTSAAVSIGTGDTFGFPVSVASWDQFLDFYWNNANISVLTGFTAADATSPATNATNHVRGSYKIQGDTSNGTKSLTCYIHMSQINSNNMTSAYGVVPA